MACACSLRRKTALLEPMWRSTSHKPAMRFRPLNYQNLRIKMPVARRSGRLPRFGERYGAFVEHPREDFAVLRDFPAQKSGVQIALRRVRITLLRRQGPRQVAAVDAMNCIRTMFPR